MPILTRQSGSASQALVVAARADGIAFDGSWADVSRFIKHVNDSWGRGGGELAGWLPPRTFEQVSRLNLDRTLTALSLGTYFLEALELEPTPWGNLTRAIGVPWCAVLPEAEGLEEVLHVPTTGPISPGVMGTLVDTYGIPAPRPEVGLSLIYAFERGAEGIQGWSLPYLVVAGDLLPVFLPPDPEATFLSSFYDAPFDGARQHRHLERYREVYGVPDLALRTAATQIKGLLESTPGVRVLHD